MKRKLLSLLVVFFLCSSVASADLAAQKNTALTSGQGTVNVLTHPGWVFGLVVTTAGSVSTVCYDNASATSGTIVLVTPATTTVGATYYGAGGPTGTPLVNGLTCSQVASTAAVTVSTSK